MESADLGRAIRTQPNAVAARMAEIAHHWSASIRRSAYVPADDVTCAAVGLLCSMLDGVEVMAGQMIHATLAAFRSGDAQTLIMKAGAVTGRVDITPTAARRDDDAPTP